MQGNAVTIISNGCGMTAWFNQASMRTSFFFDFQHEGGAMKRSISFFVIAFGLLFAALVPALAQEATPAAEPASAVTLEAAAPPATMVELPDINASALFEGKTGGTFGEQTVNILPRSNKVVIAGFSVSYLTYNSLIVKQRGSVLRGTDESRSTTQIRLNGLSDAALQDLTDRVFARFVEQLEAAGREVVPMDQVAPFWSGVEVHDSPWRGKDSATEWATFSPRGVAMFDPNGMGNLKGMAKLTTHFTNCIVIAPNIVVDFARMSGEASHGYSGTSASSSAEPSLAVTVVKTNVGRATTGRQLGMGFEGDYGEIHSNQWVVSPAGFATLEKIGSSDNKATRRVFNVLGQAAGLGNVAGAAKGKQTLEATTTDAQYTRAAAGVLEQATGRFAKWFAENPATGR